MKQTGIQRLTLYNLQKVGGLRKNSNDLDIVIHELCASTASNETNGFFNQADSSALPATTSQYRNLNNFIN